MKCLVRINTIDAVKRFVSICTKYDFGIYLLNGDGIIDAKSIIAIFGLNLCKNIAFEAHCSEEEKIDLSNDLKDFIVEV